MWNKKKNIDWTSKAINLNRCVVVFSFSIISPFVIIRIYLIYIFLFQISSRLRLLSMVYFYDFAFNQASVWLAYLEHCHDFHILVRFVQDFEIQESNQPYLLSHRQIWIGLPLFYVLLWLYQGEFIVDFTKSVNNEKKRWSTLNKLLRLIYLP